jgi:hypothetical protein
MQILGPQYGGPPYGPDFFPDASQAPSYERMVSISGGTVFIFGVEYLFNANFRAAIWWTTLWAGFFSQMLLKRPHMREWYLFPEVLGFH